MDHFKKINRVLWLILFANFGVAALKILIGGFIRSASLSADGFHSLTDGSSNIVGLIAMKIAAKPVDRDHPYGHKKFETLAGLSIAGMLFFIAGQIVISAFGRLINPVPPEVSMESLIALIATLCVNIFVSVYEYRQGRKLNSDILISDSMHTRSDIFVSAGVLVTLVCIRAGLPPIIDPIASLAVAAFIFRAAFEIFSAESRVLVDTIAIDDGVVRKIVMGFPQVRDAHEIRSRGRTDDVHVDLHIMTDSQMSVAESHALTHEIESKLQRELNQNIQVIVHLEPYQSARDGSSAC